MNLSQLGLSTMNAARARLLTAAHNINNSDTAGYSRQSVVVSTAGATATGQGFYGRGVQVDTVRRAYDAFLSNQFVSAQTKGAMLVAYGSQVSRLDSFVADDTVGVAPAIQQFFVSVQAVGGSPEDPAVRQEMIGRTKAMVDQFNSMNKFLNDQRNDINGQIQTSVAQINSYAQRVAELNKQIAIAAGSSGQVPNDLLDQRDQAVAELSALAKVNVLDQGGQYSLTIGNGQLLVSGSDAFKVTAEPSDSDPRDLAVYMTMPSGKGLAKIELNETSINGGSLSGLLTYRKQSLDEVQRQLGRLATGLALEVNAAQANGLDLKGEAGAPMFQIGQPDVLANAKNQGNGVATAAINLDAAAALRAADYDIRFDGSIYTVTRQPDNEQIYSGTDLNSAQIDGMTLSMSGTPAAGDAWKLMPGRDAAGKLTMVLTDPGKIAAASTDGGSANGANMLALAKMQDAKPLAGGTMGFNEAFSQIVDKIALDADQNSAQARAQSALLEQSYAAQQAVSGVNLDEEYVNLDRFQEQYVAASKLIEISASLFDTLMGIRA